LPALTHAHRGHPTTRAPASIFETASHNQATPTSASDTPHSHPTASGRPHRPRTSLMRWHARVVKLSRVRTGGAAGLAAPAPARRRPDRTAAAPGTPGRPAAPAAPRAARTT